MIVRINGAVLDGSWENVKGVLHEVDEILVNDHLTNHITQFMGADPDRMAQELFDRSMELEIHNDAATMALHVKEFVSGIDWTQLLGMVSG